MKIIGVCGSQRLGSLSRMALEAAGKNLDHNDSFEILDWDAVPAFDPDRLGEKTPKEVLNAAAALRNADAILIASPEYNYSVPGMLKNLIDWLSKIDDKPLSGKPVAIFSATTGQLGGARMQYDLRKVLLCVNADVLSKPEVFISRAKEKFNEQGECVDVETAKALSAQVAALLKAAQK